MQLKLRHLEVFTALLEAGSVSRAAERLNLTQPAVSIALGNLETQLGFRLFHRERGYFAPTAEAMQLHDEVAQGLRAIARIERRAAEIRTGATGGVSIATNGALAVNFLPRLIAGFRGDNSGVGVELRVHSSRQIAAWVAAGQIDIGLIDTPVPVAGLSTEIFRLECVCVMQAKDPLAAEPVVTPAHLRDRSIIGVTGDHAVDRQLETHLSKTGAPVKRDVTSYFFAIGRNIVAEGGGVAIIDPVNGKADLGDGVVWRRFEPRIDHEAAMITARGQILSDAAKAVRQLVRDGLKAVGAETTGVE